MERYTADLETTTDPADCRPWAYGLYNIESETVEIGTDLADLFAHFTKKSATVYFHNLKFDGDFIMYWLFENGFEYRLEKSDLCTNSFTTLITDTGQWYTMAVCFKKTQTQTVILTINDSLKLLPFKVSQVAEAFGLEEKKGEIDYKKPRPVGYQPDDEERSYITNDVTIMGKALKQLFVQNLKSITIGANALKSFKKLMGARQFERTFPIPDYDDEIRLSYRGGFTYCKPKYRSKQIGSGIVLDVNSLYPYVMYDKPMPVGDGVHFTGKYEPMETYPLFIQMIKCQFELKPEHIPTIQIKTPSRYFNPVEYTTTSGVEEIVLCLTSVDLELFFEQYDTYNVEYLGGWAFHAATGLFKDYIDNWMAAKTKAKIEDNPGLYTLAKLMLNSLYGKFATNPNVRSKVPVYDPDERFVRLTLGEKEQRKPVYIPVGSFITAYAREITIRAAQAVYDRFVYADTDSLHLIGTGLPDCLDIDPARLGAWDHEFTFEKAFFIRSKSYVEFGSKTNKPDDKYLKVTCAGLPERCHDQVSFENFRSGMKYKEKLRPKRVPGGVVLENCEFRIKDVY